MQSMYRLTKVKYSLTTKKEVDIFVYKTIGEKPRSKTRGGKHDGCITMPTKFIGREVIVGILKEATTDNSNFKTASPKLKHS